MCAVRETLVDLALQLNGVPADLVTVVAEYAAEQDVQSNPQFNVRAMHDGEVRVTLIDAPGWETHLRKRVTGLYTWPLCTPRCGAPWL